MKTFRIKVIEQDAEIARLTLRVNGLEEEESDAAKNLDDVITTNNALILENSQLKDRVSNLEFALVEKEKQINILMREYNTLVHKEKKNAKRVALLVKSHELCQQC